MVYREIYGGDLISQKFKNHDPNWFLRPLWSSPELKSLFCNGLE